MDGVDGEIWEISGEGWRVNSRLSKRREQVQLDLRGLQDLGGLLDLEQRELPGIIGEVRDRAVVKILELRELGVRWIQGSVLWSSR